MKTTQTISAINPIKATLLMAFGIALMMVLMPSAYAYGLDTVNEFMENIKSVLSGVALLTVTVAIMWAGFKFLFRDADFMEVGKIVIAGLLIGGATELSTYLVG